MVNSWIAVCILAIWATAAAVTGQKFPPVPPPEAATPVASAEPPDWDCPSMVYNLVYCMSYLGGTADEKPDASCCYGFKSVVEGDPGCVCQGLKSQVELGAVVNLTKAAALPADCGVDAPPLTGCDVSAALASPPAPAPAPANLPPTAAPTPDSANLPPTPAPHVAINLTPTLSPESPVDQAAPPFSVSPAPSPSTIGRGEGGGKVSKAPVPSSPPHSGAHSLANSFAVYFTTATTVSFFFFFLA